MRSNAMETTSTIIWDKARQELKNFVYRKVRDRALAEDIVHDVFLKVHTKRDQLKDDGKIVGWLYQITRHVITDHYRSLSKTIDPRDLDWESDRQDFNDCAASCLGEKLETLPEKYKDALKLTEMENLSQTDLAKRLNISYSGAKSRVQRAKQMLKEKMDEQYLIKTDAYGNVIVCEDRVPCNCSSSVSEVYQ